VNLNPREWNLLLGTAVVVLLGSTWMAGEPKLAEWTALEQTRTELDLQRRRSESQIARRDHFLRNMETVKLVLPQYPVNRDLQSEFLQRIQAMAEKSNLLVSGMEPEKEKGVGASGLFKMAINASWRGGVRELVPFLYDLQIQGVLMDVRQLKVTADASGQLRGNLIVDFAYSRGDQPAATAEAVAAAPAPPAPAPVPAPPVEAQPTSEAAAAPSPPPAEASPAAPASAAALPPPVLPSPTAAPPAVPSLPRPPPSLNAVVQSEELLAAATAAGREPTLAIAASAGQAGRSVHFLNLPLHRWVGELERLTGRKLKADTAIPPGIFLAVESKPGLLLQPREYLLCMEEYLRRKGVRLQAEGEDAFSFATGPATPPALPAAPAQPATVVPP
jgi:hypothetical protein